MDGERGWMGKGDRVGERERGNGEIGIGKGKIGME